MSKEKQNSTFKELLDKLQQESWQLELLISGFAILGLFSATDTLSLKFEIAQHDQHLAESLVWFALSISCWILIANLLIHVILRGLWIGALGLRYISGDIDYEVLKYSPKFTNYLKKRIGSFDNYIATLEDYCSILFAVSFLFIFYFLASFLCFITLLTIIFVFLDNDFEGYWENIFLVIGIGLMIFTLIGILLTFIDFLTQGFLKRKKWTSKIYFPIYRIFNVITLSFLYRPLVYNFLDNKFGKRLSFILVPIYIGILYLSSFKYTNSNYLNINRKSSEFVANSNNYDESILKENDFINKATIQSKVITDNYLKIFIVFNDNLEERLFDYNPSLRPKNDRRGLSSGVVFNNNYDISFKKLDSLRKAYYKTFNQVYLTKINDTYYKTNYVVSSSKNKKLGFETYVTIDSLKEGKHLLKINRKYINNKKDTILRNVVQIPFWKFKK
ncbi:hypothetical protein [Polaribacter sp. R77954]|uniref:hypothetical protein n=1 Tax=Polaribacter sp. R77954 TaxID=3093870 RepID=UPI0037CB34BE